MFDVVHNPIQVFPDWFANNTQAWWTGGLRNWSAGGIEFSGLWLDMNEASSFCTGSWYVLNIVLFLLKQMKVNVNVNVAGPELLPCLLLRLAAR